MCGISTAFSDGKKFTWCLAAACPGRGSEEKTVTKHKVVPSETQGLGSAGKAETLLVPGRDLQARLSLHLSDPVTPPWNPQLPLQHSSAPRQGCAPAQDFQQKIYSHTERKGRFELRKSCFTLKAAKSLNREEGGRRRNQIPAPALLHSPAFIWRTFLTSNQGVKGVRLKGV